ncbi:MAG: HEAT repeat domain-containing protein [Cyanobacteria bacterium J06636_16]
MDIDEVKINLQHSDYDYRIKAITALRNHSPEAALPLLIKHIQDPEFLVRSFVARELGHQRTANAFAGLLEIMRFDNTPNVRAEAANSLSLFGRAAVSHLVQTFARDEHWLVRRSILAALLDMDCPEELLEICQLAMAGEDNAVQESSVDALGTLATSSQQDTALAHLFTLKASESPRIRARVAYALRHFDTPEARAALAELRGDSNHIVVAAAMESLLEP